MLLLYDGYAMCEEQVGMVTFDKRLPSQVGM